MLATQSDISATADVPPLLRQRAGDLEFLVDDLGGDALSVGGSGCPLTQRHPRPVLTEMRKKTMQLSEKPLA